jgi:UDP-glucose 4-epimerase
VLVHVPAWGRARPAAETRLWLLDAEEHAGIERAVVLSAADVYRIQASEPTLIDEDHPLELSANAPPALRERVESDVIACARFGVSRLPIAVLRCAELLAPGSGGQLFDYLGSRVCFRPLGYDPMLNVLSLPDVAEAVRLAALSREPGVFNVPGADTLPLSELIHAVGRLGVAVPGPALGPLYGLRAAATAFRFRYAPERRLFHYGAILDGGRAERALGYTPRHRIALGALFSGRR